VVRFRAEAKRFSPIVQSVYGSHPASYSFGTGCPYPGRKWPRSEADHSPLPSVPRLGIELNPHTAIYLCGVYRDNDYKYLHAIVMRKEIFATFCPDAVSLLVETFADTGAISISRRKRTRASTGLTVTVVAANRKLKCQLNYLLSG
jgi:hypothetical protein